jgi:hypothetical protein
LGRKGGKYGPERRLRRLVRLDGLFCLDEVVRGDGNWRLTLGEGGEEDVGEQGTGGRLLLNGCEWWRK